MLNLAQLKKRELTAQTMPKGFWWDEDGACFEAELCSAGDPEIWRWGPLNIIALEKWKPDKELFPCAVHMLPVTAKRLGLIND